MGLFSGRTKTVRFRWNHYPMEVQVPYNMNLGDAMQLIRHQYPGAVFG